MAAIDSRGVKRGSCTDCTCDGYDGGPKKRKCVRCKHPPVKHMNLSQPCARTGQSSASVALSYDSGSGQSVYAQCLYSGCTEEAYCDLNTGDEKPYCKRHLTTQQSTWPAAPTVYSNRVGTAPCSSQQPGSRRSDGYIVPAQGSVQGVLNPVQTPHTAIASSPLLLSSTAICSPSAQQSSSRRSQSLSLPIARPSSSVVRTQYVNPVMPQAITGQQQQLCMLPGCNQPVWVEPGRVYDFCRRSHAREFWNLQQPENVPSHLQCITPGCVKQKYPNPNGGYHDYCSQYCRSNGVAPLASASAPNLIAAGTDDITCSLPGCNAPRYCDSASGRIYDYCGRTHASQARVLGIQPTYPVPIRPANRQQFTQISGKFTADWAKAKGNCPKVDFVFVISSTFLEQTWAGYKASLADQTVEQHYHGTKLTCNITVTQTLCGDTNCGICGIACNGLDPLLIQQNISFQRFGRGFYLAPNSSKCHDYTQGCNGYRAMLLCDVCPGKKHYLLSDSVQLTGPPSGCDSVYGQVGGCLNYPEIVVYNQNAVMPRYIIVYQKNGTHKIAS